MANIVLPEVEIISAINNNTNILIEDNGEIKRIAADAFAQNNNESGSFITVDKTLSIEGAAADASIVGNEIGQVEFNENLTSLFDYKACYLDKTGRESTPYATGGCTDYIKCDIGDTFIWSGQIDTQYNYAVCEYDQSKTLIKGATLASNSYTDTYNIPYIITEGTYVRFCTIMKSKSSLFKSKTFDGITYLKNISDDYIYSTSGYYISKSGTETAIEGATITLTDYIPCREGTRFIASLHSRYNTAGCCFYNANKQNVLTGLMNFENTSIGYYATNEEVIAPANSSYVRFCSYEGNRYPLKLYMYADLSLRHADYRLNEMIKESQKSNILYGKKYVACGDSFTQGDFSNYTDENGKTGRDSDAYDLEKKMWKTYPWHIADRNSMTLINEAKSGSDFVNLDGASNPFSVSRYLAVPTDADYITLEFGLNETGIGSNTAQIGTKTDTTNETLWGAYNIVFEHFYTNMPFAKIGVILSDAWMPESYSSAVKEICKYWGVPVLDFKGDPSVPMTIGGKTYEVSAKAKALKNAAFQVTNEDSHPNYKAHIYKSTIIENFLRSL